MWPFTGKRLFGSRWWAIAFVLFICLQVMLFAGPSEPSEEAADAAQMQAMTDALNKF